MDGNLTLLKCFSALIFIYQHHTHSAYATCKPASKHSRYSILDIAQAWRDKGWNVGIFFWNQLADTDTPYQAESKIYTTFGPDQMNWWGYQYAQINNGIINYSGLQDNDDCLWHGQACPAVQVILDQEVLQALKRFHGPELRIVGHSLGAQLAIGLTYDLVTKVSQHQLLPYFMPRQLVLLDPYFTPYDSANYPWLFGRTPKELNTSKVTQMISRDGILVSEYLSSDLTNRDLIGKLSHEVAMIWYEPYFDWWFDEMDKHSAAYILYFLSQKDSPPLSFFTDDSGTVHQEPEGAASASVSELRLGK